MTRTLPTFGRAGSGSVRGGGRDLEQVWQVSQHRLEVADEHPLRQRLSAGGDHSVQDLPGGRVEDADREHVAVADLGQAGRLRSGQA